MPATSANRTNRTSARTFVNRGSHVTPPARSPTSWWMPSPARLAVWLGATNAPQPSVAAEGAFHIVGQLRVPVWAGCAKRRDDLTLALRVFVPTHLDLAFK